MTANGKQPESERKGKTVCWVRVRGRVRALELVVAKSNTRSRLGLELALGVGFRVRVDARVRVMGRVNKQMHSDISNTHPQPCL